MYLLSGSSCYLSMMYFRCVCSLKPNEYGCHLDFSVGSAIVGRRSGPKSALRVFRCRSSFRVFGHILYYYESLLLPCVRVSMMVFIPSFIWHCIIKSLIGPDGWCIYYEKSTRKCSIYADRPYICQVEPGIFEESYGIDKKKFQKEACSCCVDTIKVVYGLQLKELDNFNRAIWSTSSQ